MYLNKSYFLIIENIDASNPAESNEIPSADNANDLIAEVCILFYHNFFYRIVSHHLRDPSLYPPKIIRPDLEKAKEVTLSDEFSAYYPNFPYALVSYKLIKPS